jgi:hypothetical protein
MRDDEDLNIDRLIGQAFSVDVKEAAQRTPPPPGNSVLPLLKAAALTVFLTSLFTLSVSDRLPTPAHLSGRLQSRYEVMGDEIAFNMESGFRTIISSYPKQGATDE